MKIQFCDLCNESVPEADFAKGKAFMRQGRVVCVACDNAMTHNRPPESDATRLSAGVGPGETMSNRPSPGLASLQGARVPQRAAGSSAWIGILALVVAGGGGWLFSRELGAVQEQAQAQRAQLDRELTRVEGNLDRFSLSAQRRGEALEVRLGNKWDVKQIALEGQLASVREELVVATTTLSALEVELVRLVESQRTDTRERSRELDQLLTQSMKSRIELETLGKRLDRAEGSMAQGVPSVSAVPAAAPTLEQRYAAQLADLADDVAGTRWNGVQSLGETGDPAVIPYLVPLLKDSDVFVRMAVARVFGDLGAPEAIEPLIDTLEDEEPIVREAAMAGLHILTGRDFRFDPNAKSAERSKRVGAWRSWWAKASSEFLGDA